MRFAVAILLLTTSFAQAEDVPPDGFCVKNNSGHSYLFQTETREGARQSVILAPGEQLCATESQAKDGVIRVFESAEAVEGCGRIVPTGETETFISYAEFDRCRWGAHGS